MNTCLGNCCNEEAGWSFYLSIRAVKNGFLIEADSGSYVVATKEEALEKAKTLVV